MTVETIKRKTALNETGFTVWPFVGEVYVARLTPEATLPTRKHSGDAGLDFYASVDTIIPPHSVKVVKTGITMELPPHYFALAKPKSGTDVDILAGVIDPTYQGEILFKVYNPSEYPVSFKQGQAVGQIVIIPIIRPPVIELSLEQIHEQETDRGDTGGILKDVK